VVQDKKVFLYKLYDTSSKLSRPRTLEPIFIIKLFKEIENKINNTEKKLLPSSLNKSTT